MGSRAARATCLIGLLALLTMTAGVLGSQATPTSSTTVPVSPSVMATIVHVGGALKLMALWRGEPRWYLGRGTRHGSGGSGEHTVWISEQYGDVTIDLSFDTAQNVVTIGKTTTRIPPGSNVLLIDGVGTPKGPHLTSPLTVDPGSANTDPHGGGLGPFLAISPDVAAFLRCDTAPPDGPFARTFGYCNDLATK